MQKKKKKEGDEMDAAIAGLVFSTVLSFLAVFITAVVTAGTNRKLMLFFGFILVVSLAILTGLVPLPAVALALGITAAVEGFAILLLVN